MNARYLAEAVRFELTDGFPSPVFKTGAIDHSATLPQAADSSSQRVSLSMRSTPCCQGGRVNPNALCRREPSSREFKGRRAGVG